MSNMFQVSGRASRGPRASTIPLVAVIAWAASACGTAPNGTATDIEVSQDELGGNGCTQTTRNGHTYRFCSTPQTFDNARKTCQAAGVDLSPWTMPRRTPSSGARSPARLPRFERSQPRRRMEMDRRQPALVVRRQHGQAVEHHAVRQLGSFELATQSCQYKTRNGRGYWFCDSWTDWESARKNCAGGKMALARIEDSAKTPSSLPRCSRARG